MTKTIKGGTRSACNARRSAESHPAADPKALAVWQDITPLARNEWICWVISPKQAETRSRPDQGRAIKAQRRNEAALVAGQAVPIGELLLIKKRLQRLA